jgi:uncharacterized protein
MTPSLTDTLCARCGLCCDGSLFADVELAGGAEARRLEALGLAIEDDEADRALLSQPCRALRGTRCGIYADRPECCRTFECRLLQDVRIGSVSLERAQRRIVEALTRIGRVKALIATVGRRGRGLPLAESCAETLAGDADADPRRSRKRAELERAMAAVEKSIGATFLAESGSRASERRERRRQRKLIVTEIGEAPSGSVPRPPGGRRLAEPSAHIGSLAKAIIATPSSAPVATGPSQPPNRAPAYQAECVPPSTPPGK